MLTTTLLLLACRTDTKPEVDTGQVALVDEDTAEPDDTPVDTGPFDADQDGVAAADDCDDLDPSVGAEQTWYADADGDGYGHPSYSDTGCTQPDGYVDNAEDCDDGAENVHPGADEPDCTDPVDYNCDGSVGYADADADGFAACEECDDNSSAIHPNALEVCNGVDDDCSGSVDDDASDASTWYADADGDGYGDPGAGTEACDAAEGQVSDATDCDDTDDAVNPAATELCNEQDDDCDGLVDDDDPDLADASTWYRDADGDGYGRSDVSQQSCSAESGWVADATDCDDDAESANPAGSEVCDGLDNDCNGTTDDGASDASTWYADADGDGFGDATSSADACEAGSGEVADATDCDDGDSAVHPDADELCNGVDDDCSGGVDDDPSDQGSWYVDGDGDGFGSDETVEACDQPSGSSEADGDCDDADDAVHPEADEVCNGVDDDCNGWTDDDDPGLTDASTWYLDHDGDTYGDPDLSTDACEAPASYVADDQDCDDLDATVNPELIWYADADGDGFGDVDDDTTGCEQPSGRVADATDCDDGADDVYPGAPEVCDASLDADCDGVTPDGCSSCLEILDSGGSSGDGLYPIDPDGPDGALAEVDTWCDMSTDGGGWTLVQRTVWDWSESSQLETDYASWYGDTLGSADEGYAFRLLGQAWPLVADETEMLVTHALRTTDGGVCDPLYYDGSFTSLEVGEETASWDGFSSGVTLVNDAELSTTDSGPSSGCVTGYDAAPWFYSWCCTTCPTFKGGYWTDEAHPMASYTGSSSDLYGNLEDDVCGSAEVQMNDNGSSYRGVDAMDVYLR